MKINALTKKMLLTSLLVFNASVHAANISVYGAEQGKQLTPSKQTNNHYFLQMGSFKNKRYATEYLEHLAQKTNQPVHLVHQTDRLASYAVFLGPFEHVTQVNQTSCEILGEQKSSPLAPSLALHSEAATTMKLTSPRKTLSTRKKMQRHIA